ncbi:uncharacterized protein LOC126689018 [Quercus robur]|uniref:uncharacterized protein LOC126689018 n=1 Tax=Quercus robur TaxID=38942 RepID=UPI00216112E4|nr:uncharacterized protein LOC126689018 [Quercus robur]
MWTSPLGVGCGHRRWAWRSWDVEIGVGRWVWRSAQRSVYGFVHLWCELFIYGSDFAGFCFGGGGVMGSEAGAVCLSFVAFLEGGGGGGFSGRETEAFLDGGGGGGFSGRETEEEN